MAEGPRNFHKPEDFVVKTQKSVPAGLSDAYRDYIEVLPEDKSSVRIPILGNVFTQKELVEHLVVDDVVGRDVAGVFLEAAKGKMEDSGILNPTDEQVLEETINGFRNATAQLREMKNPQ